MGYLYKLDFSNDKSYIGITTKTPEKRFEAHNRRSRTSRKNTKKDYPIYNSWRKYGKPKLIILAKIEDYDLEETEIRAIKFFNTLIPNGYNSSPGGRMSSMKNPLVAKKVSNSKKGIPLTKLHKEKLRISAIGIKNSKEHIENSRKGHIGLKYKTNISHLSIEEKNVRKKEQIMIYHKNKKEQKQRDIDFYNIF